MGILMLTVVLSAQEHYARRDAITLRADFHPPLDTLAMARYWQQTVLHSEAFYNGDGSWGMGFFDWPTRPYDADHPLVRVVAHHVLGLLLLIEHNLSDSAMVTRCRISLNWLLERQTPQGAWPLYTSNQGAITRHSVIPTALAGVALSRGYKVLGNPRYLLAASRALEWQKARPEDDSTRNHGLLLLHIMEHYRTVNDQQLLDWAIKEGLIILQHQLPNGSWSDPGPVTVGEHAIITMALLELEQTLVNINPFRRRIWEGVTGALNNLLENQLPDGNFRTGSAEIVTIKVPTFELIALIGARRSRRMVDFDMPIRGAIRALNIHPSNADRHWRANQAGRFLAMSHALVWFTGTQSKMTVRPSVDFPGDSLRENSVAP